MHTGMLWFDDTPDIPLKDRIEKAVMYYRGKYHKEPNLCLVHPSMNIGNEAEYGKITVRNYKPILPPDTFGLVSKICGRIKYI